MPFVITEDTAVTLPFNPCHFLLKDIVIKPQKKKKRRRKSFQIRIFPLIMKKRVQYFHVIVFSLLRQKYFIIKEICRV